MWQIIQPELSKKEISGHPSKKNLKILKRKKETINNIIFIVKKSIKATISLKIGFKQGKLTKTKGINKYYLRLNSQNKKLHIYV